jgi:hypothetical protein
VGVYLAGTRVFLEAASAHGRIGRLFLLVGTFMFARLEAVLTAHEYVWVLAIWVVLCAFAASRQARDPDGALARRDRYAASATP